MFYRVLIDNLEIHEDKLNELFPHKSSYSGIFKYERPNKGDVIFAENNKKYFVDNVEWHNKKYDDGQITYICSFYLKTL